MKTWRVQATRSTTQPGDPPEVWPTESFDFLAQDVEPIDSEKSLVCRSIRSIYGEQTLTTTSSKGATLDSTARLTWDLGRSAMSQTGKFFRVGDGYYFRQVGSVAGIGEHGGSVVADSVDVRFQYSSNPFYEPAAGITAQISFGDYSQALS